MGLVIQMADDSYAALKAFDHDPASLYLQPC
jgi:hypothetical protein